MPRNAFVNAGRTSAEQDSLNRLASLPRERLCMIQSPACGGGLKMRRTSVWTFLFIALLCLGSLAQASAPQANAPAPVREQAPSGRFSSTPASQTITNAHVIRMVKAGVPESAIISSIQSNRGEFDLSPDGLLALHRAGVSQKILETMMAGGRTQSSPNASTKTAITGNSAAPAQAAGAATNPIPQANLGAAKVGTKVKNPHASQASAAIIAVLQKQRGAADAEAAQMKAAARSQAPVGVVAGQPQPMSAGGAGQTSLPAVQSQALVATNNGQKPMLVPGTSQTLLPAAQSPAAVTTNNGPKPMLPATSQTLLPAVQAQSPVATNNGQKSAPSVQPQKNRVAMAASPAMQKTSTAGTIGSAQTFSATNATSNSSMGLISSPQSGTLSSVTLAPGGSGPSQSGGSGGYQGGSAGPSQAGCAGSSGGGCAGPSQGGSWGPTSPPPGGGAGPRSLYGGSAGPSSQLQGSSSGGGGMSSAGSSGANSKGNFPSSMTHVAPINSTALICTNNPQFRILTVSGSSYPATFTPIDQYNLYTISGCSFGDPGSNDKVYIYGVGSFQGNFTIKFWSDNSIVVSLDESITGVPDMSNLTLVVQRADGQQTQMGGFSFYAVRATVPLSSIPSSWAELATLDSASAYGNKTMVPQYSSPPTTPPGPSAGTVYVSRTFNGAKFPIPAGLGDGYRFHLAPGFTLDSFQLTTYPQNCPGVVTYSQDFGTWATEFNPDTPNYIGVTIADTTCSGFNAAVFFAPWTGNYQNLTGSYYALAVWVNGPRGIDPITGQPGQ